MSFYLVSILRSPMRNMFSYFSKDLLKVVVILSEYVAKLEWVKWLGRGLQLLQTPSCIALHYKVPLN